MRPLKIQGSRALSATLGLLLILAPAAQADEADEPQEAQQADVAQEPAPARRAAPAIEQITVTARKREERLIDAPIAASVLTHEEIERYHTVDLQQLTTRIPGLTIVHASGGGAGGNMVIRGIGQQTSDYGADQPVALVLDGMSFTRGHVLDVGFFDVAGIEVLKGPQTLFWGKNSPAGVISVNSVSPGDEYEGFARVSYEFEQEDRVVEFGVSYPISEMLAVRVAGRFQDMSGGYLKNSSAVIPVNPLNAAAGLALRGPSYDVYPQQEQEVTRITAVYTPIENFEAKFKWFWSESEQNDGQGNTILFACADGVGTNPYFNDLFGGQLVPDPTQTCTSEPKHRRNGSLPPAEIANAHPFIDAGDRLHNTVRNAIYTLEMNYTFGDLTFTSLSGFWRYKHREYTNYDWTSYAVVVSQQGESGESFTQELRVQSSFDSPFNFMLGAFWEDMERDLDAPVQIFSGGPTAQPGPYFGSWIAYHQHWDNDIQSLSFFGSADWQISEYLELSGGVRYTDEERDTVGGNLFEAFGIFSPGGVMYSPEDDFDNWSPEVTLSWHPTDDTLVYGAFKTGFQSAGISNPGTVSNLTALTPAGQTAALVFGGSEVDGFEVGVKGSFFDNRLTGDLTVYRYEYEDLQVAIFDPITTTFTIQNAAAATNQGIEANATFQVDEFLQLRLAAQYNDLEYDDYDDAQCYPGQPVQATGPGCHVGPTGSNVQDMSGEQYGGPPFQFNIGATYDRPILDDWSLALTGDVIYHDEGQENLNQPLTDIDSRTVTNFSARIYQTDGPWELAVICTNCFDEVYVYGIGNKPLAKTGDLTAAIARPRLITVQLGYRW
jgi:outer membrane receptor protein involved in Fe transport